MYETENKNELKPIPIQTCLCAEKKCHQSLDRLTNWSWTMTKKRSCCKINLDYIYSRIHKRNRTGLATKS